MTTPPNTQLNSPAHLVPSRYVRALTLGWFCLLPTQWVWHIATFDNSQKFSFKDLNLEAEVNCVVFKLEQAFCLWCLSGDSCARRFLSLAERDPGVGSWEAIHSKSGGHKT